MTDDLPASQSPDSAAPPADNGPREFIRAWAESLAQVLGQIAGSAVPVEALAAAPADVPVPEESDLRVTVVAAGGLRGEMSLRIPQTSAMAMVKIFMGEAPAAEDKAGPREEIEELLRQVAGYVSTALKPRWAEVQFHLESGPPPSWSPGAGGWLASPADAPVRIQLEWQLSAALHAALLAAPAASAPTAEPLPAEQTPVSSVDGGMVEGNLGLLLDVELDVMLRFGERNMPLREILELDTGAVVELNRQVDDPVDLLLDGRVIARGEVVVVNGNYGLRVHELLVPPIGN
jgi:flagellar motor switch protein FliN